MFGTHWECVKGVEGIECGALEGTLMVLTCAFEVGEQAARKAVCCVVGEVAVV